MEWLWVPRAEKRMANQIPALWKSSDAWFPATFATLDIGSRAKSAAIRIRKRLTIMEQVIITVMVNNRLGRRYGSTLSGNPRIKANQIRYMMKGIPKQIP